MGIGTITAGAEKVAAGDDDPAGETRKSVDGEGTAALISLLGADAGTVTEMVTGTVTGISLVSATVTVIFLGRLGTLLYTIILFCPQRRRKRGEILVNEIQVVKVKL